jgi:ribosomal peptide maturation radical SAM protein 1
MDVAFAVVPFADIARPAIGVSLLKAGLATRGITSQICYFNIPFAETIGDDLYSHISDQVPADSMAGEWFFADLVFPGELPPAHEYVRNVLGDVMSSAMLRRMLDARGARPEFIENCAKTLGATKAPIVGFTTTFHQTCACLAIAKRLKEMPNPPLICFGGANCEGEMGMQMLRAFHWIDYVCTREGDNIFPQFVEGFLKHGRRAELPGLLHKESKGLTYPPMVEDMDGLPIPDYDDFVNALKISALDGKVKREIQIEAARGCWWGAKHHCTFCGLNGDTMPYRSKSPDRVYREIKYLYERYGYKRIDSVDNILDHRYISSVFPRLAEEGIELEMFYEVKANLKYSQLRTIKRGGVSMIQPGIESFSTQILKLMEKGVSAAQNVQLLRWSEELGILPAWNILAGFPGEQPSEYDGMAELVPLLAHLEPPTGCSQIRLDRFSPLFNKAETVGIRQVRPTLAYYYVFPLGRRDLAKLAYFFDFDYEDGRKPETYIRRLQAEIIKWRNARFHADAACRPRLDAILLDDVAVRVADTRNCAVAPELWLKDLDAMILIACDVAHPRHVLDRRFATAHGSLAVTEALGRLLSWKLVVEIDTLFLSLPVIRNRRPEMTEMQSDVYKLSETANPEPLLRVL